VRRAEENLLSWTVASGLLIGLAVIVVFVVR
jgi:hypothetical protein